MEGAVKSEAEAAVEELRLRLSLYEGIELHPESRLGKQLETARNTVAAYEALERGLSADAA